MFKTVQPHLGAKGSCINAQEFSTHIQGYLAHKKPPPPQDFHRALGIVLL